MDGVSLEAIFYAFLRLSAFFVVMPFPGLTTPGPVKVVLAGTLAWSLTSPGPAPVLGVSAMILEVLLGLVAGFLIRVVVQAFTFGGEAAGTQMGLASIGFFNPLESQITLLGSAFTFLVLGLFALGDGPARLLAFLHRFLELMPAGEAELRFDPLLVASREGSRFFVLGLMTAAPMIAAVFCAQVVLAVLARAVPTLNLLVEGPALTVSAGIVGFFASLHSFGGLVTRALAEQLELVGRLLFG